MDEGEPDGALFAEFKAEGEGFVLCKPEADGLGLWTVDGKEVSDEDGFSSRPGTMEDKELTALHPENVSVAAKSKMAIAFFICGLPLFIYYFYMHYIPTVTGIQWLPAGLAGFSLRATFSFCMKEKVAKRILNREINSSF